MNWLIPNDVICFCALKYGLTNDGGISYIALFIGHMWAWILYVSHSYFCFSLQHVITLTGAQICEHSNVSNITCHWVQKSWNSINLGYWPHFHFHKGLPCEAKPKASCWYSVLLSITQHAKNNSNAETPDTQNHNTWW